MNFCLTPAHDKTPDDPTACFGGIEANGQYPVVLDRENGSAPEFIV
jgi:hypothetical protein